MDSVTSDSLTAARQTISHRSRTSLSIVDSGQIAEKAAPKSEGRKEIDSKDNEVSREQLDDSVRQLNDFVQSVQRDLHFSIDDMSGETIITILDSKTDEVIRQIPTEEVVALSNNIESLKGVLFSAEV